MRERGIRFRSLAEPALHLPADRPEDNRRYLLWSTDGFPKMVNGRSSLDPTFTFGLIDEVHGFPDRASVERLSDVGVRSVALHTQRVAGTAWEDAAQRPIRGLPLTRRRVGDVVVYVIRSPAG